MRYETIINLQTIMIFKIKTVCFKVLVINLSFIFITYIKNFNVNIFLPMLNIKSF